MKRLLQFLRRGWSKPPCARCLLHEAADENGHCCPLAEVLEVIATEMPGVSFWADVVECDYQARVVLRK